MDFFENACFKESKNIQLKKCRVFLEHSKVAAEANTFLNEENMKVIRNIFKEEFEKQENNVGILVSANFKVTIEEIKKSQDVFKNLGKEKCYLRNRL